MQESQRCLLVESHAYRRGSLECHGCGLRKVNFYFAGVEISRSTRVGTSPKIGCFCGGPELSYILPTSISYRLELSLRIETVLPI